MHEAVAKDAKIQIEVTLGLGSETQPYISEKITAVLTSGKSWYMSGSECFLCLYVLQIISAVYFASL